MLESVLVLPKDINDYRPFVGDQRIDEIIAQAAPLRGARVLHLNATAYGGGVAELLSTNVPLLRSVGIDAEWRVMPGGPDLWETTKAIHNLLQGASIAPSSPEASSESIRHRNRRRSIVAPWTPEMAAIWERYNALTAELFDQQYDFVVVHDPQPAGVLHFLLQSSPKASSTKWIWRCHIDLTKARPDAWSFLRPYLAPYDASIFTMQEFVKSDVPTPEVALIAPTIDPLSAKNIELSPSAISEVLHRFGIDPKRPILTQVSRFDPWKDPLGVVDVYKLVRRTVPGLQLLMVGSMATDDPEGFKYFELTARRVGEDPSVHLLTNLSGVGSLEVNALQRASSVVLQKSIREGFGLTVAEALWKARPMVATAVGGIPLQIASGQCGYLVSSNRECAARVQELLANRSLAKEFGTNGRERVRANFLTTTGLSDYLQLFNGLRAQASARVSTFSASRSRL
ncbi:MAG TPA: glycosyltransferase [Chloroflexota bacterium]|nr:glycosyltransferase [Chloroflexota bacterium]